MESLDKVYARSQMRLKPEDVFKTVHVETVDDIKRLIAELDPARNKSALPIPLNTTMVGTDENNKKVVYSVETVTRSKTRRETLLEGMDVVKKRLEVAERLRNEGEAVEVNGVLSKPALIGNDINGSFGVDKLLERWLGATRDGIFITWKLNDGYIYRYDIFGHKLSRIGLEQWQKSKQ
jgi:hypothetical protein